MGPAAPWCRGVGALAWLHYQKYNLCNRVKSRLASSSLARELPISLLLIGRDRPCILKIAGGYAGLMQADTLEKDMGRQVVGI